MSTAAKSAMADAVATLYTTFARYKTSKVEDDMPRTGDPDVAVSLGAYPLEKLPPENLQVFAARALTTLGTIENFKHYLPRLLELVVWLDSLGNAPPQFVFSRLEYAGWHGWPAREAAAVQAYFDALFHLHVQWLGNAEDDRDPLAVGHRFDDLLGCLSAADDNVAEKLARLLEQAQRHPVSAAVNVLAAWLLQVTPQTVKDGRIIEDAFAREQEAIVGAVRAPRLREVLESAFFAAPSPAKRQLFSDALQQVEWLQLASPDS